MPNKIKNPLDINLLSYLSEKARFNTSLPTLNKSVGRIYVFGKEKFHNLKDLIEEQALAWQKEDLLKSKKDIIHFLGSNGPIWIFQRKKGTQPISHEEFLESSDYAWHRVQIGAIVNSFKYFRLEHI